MSTYHYHYNREMDPLNATRGVVIGLSIGIAMWLVIAALVLVIVL